MIFKWGERVPTRRDVLHAQNFVCKGPDGNGCPKGCEKSFWMTVILVGKTFRGVCRSCYAKVTADARSKKAARTIAKKKAQLELLPGSENERSKNR